MKKFLFYLVQWTWGLPVNLIGLLIFLGYKAKGCEHEKFGYAYITPIVWNYGGFSIGLFIFYKKDHPNKDWIYDTKIHEYGHTWQALLLGPLYWFVVGIPSFIWCNALESYRKKRGLSYYKLYCEAWANAWGQKVTGMKMIKDK